MSDRLKQIVLALVGSGDGGAATGLSPAEWSRLDAIAQPHRLRPLLHQHAARCGAPDSLRAAWRVAYRTSAALGLRQASTLAEISRLFARNGIQATILKGGAWVWRGWAPPALRPMRDLDLLVEAAQAQHAQAVLCAAGFSAASPTGPGAKHLAPLHSRAGDRVELHVRVMDVPDACQADREAMLRRRLQDGASPVEGAIRETAPTDTLLHILIHSVSDHQFNNGPLTLYDTALLVRHGQIDWTRFWDTAEATGNLRAAQLGLAVAERWIPDIHIDWRIDRPASLSGDLVDRASLMMLIDPARQTELGWWGRAIRPTATGTALQVARMMRRGLTAGNRSGAIETLFRHAGVASGRAARAQVRDSIRVGAWLQDTP